MSYLQTYLEKIEAEAAEKSRIACANAALIELAAEVTARIHASAEMDVVFPSHHLIDPVEAEKYDIRSRVTLMKKGGVSNDELIDALERDAQAAAWQQRGCLRYRVNPRARQTGD